MEPLGTVFDKLKCFTKSSHDFFAGLIDRCQNSASRNPIEILKRLQREAFSDLMKLRDRQDKVEKILSFYKPSKGGPFQDATTLVRGHVDILGALLMMDNINQQTLDVISRSGIRTGVHSRLTFETNIRHKDTLVAEFVASQKGEERVGDVLGSSLSLTKLCYMAQVSDWLSMTAIPMGAQCKDVGITSNSFHQLGKGLTDVSSVGPPLLNLHCGSAIGVLVRKSNIVASLAQFVSGLGMQLGSNTRENFSSTFGELAIQFPKGMKLSLLGLYQVPQSSNELTKLGALTIPILSSKGREASETIYEAFPGLEKTQFSTRSIALMMETELDDITKIGGWIEMNKLNARCVKWGVNFSDVSEDSFGWGMSLNGMIGDSASGDLFQAESYLKFNLGDKLCLKPGLAYVIDGNSKLAGLMLRSSWSF